MMRIAVFAAAALCGTGCHPRPTPPATWELDALSRIVHDEFCYPHATCRIEAAEAYSTGMTGNKPAKLVRLRWPSLSIDEPRPWCAYVYYVVDLEHRAIGEEILGAASFDCDPTECRDNTEVATFGEVVKRAGYTGRVPASTAQQLKWHQDRSLDVELRRQFLSHKRLRDYTLGELETTIATGRFPPSSDQPGESVPRSLLNEFKIQRLITPTGPQ